MRLAVPLFLAVFVTAFCLGAEPIPQAAQQAPKAAPAGPGFKPLRYDEDFSFLADPAQRTDFWDPIKYIPIFGGRAGYLSFGGEIRERFETFENEFFSKEPDADNAYLLQRYLLHADYHPVKWFRVFGQLQGSFEDGRTGPPRPTDRGGVDINQLFADAIISPFVDASITLRVGRQEMSYGSERLISVREGTNRRRAFDAVRLLFKEKDVHVDAFFSSPVEIDDSNFDDQNIRDLWFWGGYATFPIKLVRGANLDVYYLGLHNPMATFSQGVGQEDRHTLGMRLFGKIGWVDFNTEALYQFGRFESGRISAWSVATDQGVTFENVWAKPRLGLKAAIASGDRDAADEDLQTFNPLFPRGNYFTEAALLGPSNFIAIRPRITLHPSKEWTIDTGVDFFWRENRNDGIYTPGGTVLFPGNPQFSRFVGTDISTVITWEATPHITLAAAYSHFFAGQFIRQNNGEDVNFCAVWATYRF